MSADETSVNVNVMSALSEDSKPVTKLYTLYSIYYPKSWGENLIKLGYTTSKSDAECGKYYFMGTGTPLHFSTKQELLERKRQIIVESTSIFERWRKAPNKPTIDEAVLYWISPSTTSVDQEGLSPETTFVSLGCRCYPCRC